MNIQTNENSRIVLVDALRGFALMGLFIVHMVEYFELYWYKPEPGWVHNLIFGLFGGKAYGLFAMLFGLSFYIILNNYQNRGYDFRLRFVWRLALLWVFGYLHSLIYAGDILQVLAICGLPLVLCYTWSTRWIVIIAVFFLIQIPHLLLIVVHTLKGLENYSQPLFFDLMASNFKMFAHAPLGELVAYNLVDGQKGKWAFFIETGRLWNIFGLMFVGVALGRLEFFRRTHSIRKLCLIIGVACALFIAAKVLGGTVPKLFPEGMARWCTNELFGYYQNLAAIAAGVAVFVLVYQQNIGAKLLAYWAPIGRLTLTFYILQSIVFVPLYYGFGAAWYDSMGQFWSLIIGVVAWGVQLVMARFWLEYFSYGPLELWWRKLTLLGYSNAKRS